MPGAEGGEIVRRPSNPPESKPPDEIVRRGVKIGDVRGLANLGRELSGEIVVGVESHEIGAVSHRVGDGAGEIAVREQDEPGLGLVEGVDGDLPAADEGHGVDGGEELAEGGVDGPRRGSILWPIKGTRGSSEEEKSGSGSGSGRRLQVK